MADQNNAAFIWTIANLLRGTYKQADYGKVILPFTVLRRLDSALEATKANVLEAYKKHGKAPAADFLLQQASGYSFYNTSPYDLNALPVTRETSGQTWSPTSMDSRQTLETSLSAMNLRPNLTSWMKMTYFC